MRVYIPNEIFEDSMPMIKESVSRLGGIVSIMAVEDEGNMYCLEGSHRLTHIMRTEKYPEDCIYFITVPKDHKCYMGFDNNYLVSEKNAPSWVKYDLEVTNAWKIIKGFDSNVFLDINIDSGNIIRLEDLEA